MGESNFFPPNDTLRFRAIDRRKSFPFAPWDRQLGHRFLSCRWKAHSLEMHFNETARFDKSADDWLSKLGTYSSLGRRLVYASSAFRGSTFFGSVFSSIFREWLPWDIGYSSRKSYCTGVVHKLAPSSCGCAN